MKILKLLEQRNHFLEKFYTVNETGLLEFSQGLFEGLDQFYHQREQILGVLRELDQKINSESLETASLTVEQRKAAKSHLAVKEEYVNQILKQDLQVLSCLEKAKSQIIRDLQDLKSVRKVVNSYKSTTPDRKLVEKA